MGALREVNLEWGRPSVDQALRLLEKDIKSAQFYFGIVERRAKAIAEAAEKEEKET